MFKLKLKNKAVWTVRGCLFYKPSSAQFLRYHNAHEGRTKPRLSRSDRQKVWHVSLSPIIWLGISRLCHKCHICNYYIPEWAYPLCSKVLMLNPSVGDIVLTSSPLNFFSIVVLPALSSPLKWDNVRSSALELLTRGTKMCAGKIQRDFVISAQCGVWGLNCLQWIRKEPEERSALIPLICRPCITSYKL